MRSHRKPALCAALVAALLVVCAQMAVVSAELKIFGSRVTKMVMADLGPQFEQTSGYKPVVVTDVAAVMKRRIEAGEPFDLAVLVDFQADDLIKAGKLVAETRTDVMKAGIGVAVKRGAPKPISARSRRSSARCWRPNRSPISRRGRARSTSIAFLPVSALPRRCGQEPSSRRPKRFRSELRRAR
jgi:ABC-type molybdate transport system substrate-binding protein